jgi:hypothetical protein
MRAVFVLVALAAVAHADDKHSIVLAPRLDPYSKVITDPPTPAAQAFGLGVHYLVGFPPSMPFWYGVGVDARVLTADWSDFGGLAIGGVAKVTAGHAPPLTLELDGGAILSGTDSGGYVGGAVLVSMFYFELGYSYQLPLGLDDHPWLGHHQVTLRGIIPVLTY